MMTLELVFLHDLQPPAACGELQVPRCCQSAHHSGKSCLNSVQFHACVGSALARCCQPVDIRPPYPPDDAPPASSSSCWITDSHRCSRPSVQRAKTALSWLSSPVRRAQRVKGYLVQQGRLIALNLREQLCEITRGPGDEVSNRGHFRCALPSCIAHVRSLGELWRSRMHESACNVLLAPSRCRL